MARSERLLWDVSREIAQHAALGVRDLVTRTIIDRPVRVATHTVAVARAALLASVLDRMVPHVIDAVTPRLIDAAMPAIRAHVRDVMQDQCRDTTAELA